MTLKEAINQLTEGLTSDLKERFVGISAGGKTLTLEDITRDDWAVSFKVNSEDEIEEITEETMMFICHECHHEWAGTEWEVGDEVECPKCGMVGEADPDAEIINEH